MNSVETYSGRRDDTVCESRPHLPDAAPRDRTAHTLLDSVSQGNALAFWELWGLHRAHLYQICLAHMVGVREDAEDALSRSMLRALDKLPHAGPQIDNVKAWLSRLTLNLCADIHRERKRMTRRLEHIDEDAANAAAFRPADADSPEDIFLSQEAYTTLCDAVNDLPDRLREPFALRFFQDMAYVDIAERLALSNDNVRKRIQQARDILKQRLDVSAVATGGAGEPQRPRAQPPAATPAGSHRASGHSEPFTTAPPRASVLGSGPFGTPQGDTQWLAKDKREIRSGAAPKGGLSPHSQRPSSTPARP